MVFTVRKIFEDNWHKYLKSHVVLDYQKHGVEKMLNCSRHSCNSRICSSCGKRYVDDWSSRLKGFLFPVEHRHVVLTVPSVLRGLLREWRNLKALMDSSNSFFRNILV